MARAYNYTTKILYYLNYKLFYKKLYVEDFLENILYKFHIYYNLCKAWL